MTAFGIVLNYTAESFSSSWKFIVKARRLENEDPDLADETYRIGIKEYDESIDLLDSYAKFLIEHRNDVNGAESNYKRAIQIDPHYLAALKGYAAVNYLYRDNLVAAETMLKSVLETDSNDSNALANLGCLMLAMGNKNGLEFLKRAKEQLKLTPSSDTEVECEFYFYLHGSIDQQASALRAVKKLVESGARSPGWNLSRNVQRAKKDNHSDSEWLPKLAAVIVDGAEASILDDWPAWSDAAS